MSDVERERRRITSVEVRQRIVAGLRIPAELQDVAAEAGPTEIPVPGLSLPGAAPDEDLLALVTSVVDSSHRIDVATLDWLDRLGEADDAHRLLDEAQVLIRRAPEHSEDEPVWMYFYDETWFTLQRGMAALHLRDWQEAVDQITVGLTALPDEYRRDKTWYRACLAHALAGAGESGQAASVAVASVPDAADIGRPHSWNELHTTAALLKRRGAREGAQLVAALREYD
ncbi:hypothetical protein [Streptomyces sp. NPDC057302]|uniref:hypothetical protein n=1 Tax=Streptomyces sp. NPDC057302 TaxID=3346094 RepID=UPI003641967E